jgi:hypothetical protein
MLCVPCIQVLHGCSLLSFANLCHSGVLCQELALFTTSPALAIPKAIVAASIDGKQIHLCEINQAFAVSFL